MIKAFMEYFERKKKEKFSYTDSKLDINELVSRQGFWVCFCQNQMYNLERKKDYEFTAVY